MMHLSNIAVFLLLPASSAFTTKQRFVNNHRSLSPSSSTTTTLGVSVVSEFLSQSHAQNGTASDKDILLATFETESPQSVGVQAPGIQSSPTAADYKQPNKKKKRSRKPKRKHNYAELEDFLKEIPDLDFYTLHSSAVSHLYFDMPINDITRAIKRAQNRHDVHDLQTIGAFLIDECDEHWGYGFRGTLLSRLAVAALHTGDVELAKQAIDTRRIHERPSMQPFESASIVRGLLRADLKEEAWAVLEDELRLPLPGTSLNTSENQELIKSRAHALSSIATRFFHHDQPDESKKALKKLKELGQVVAESNIAFNDLKMPWIRLEAAALECNKKSTTSSSTKGATKEDLRDYVWTAMAEFPCPDGEEECSLDSYILTP